MRFERFLQLASIDHEYKRMPVPVKVKLDPEPKIFIDPRANQYEEEGLFAKAYLVVFNYFGNTESELEQIDNALKASLFKEILPYLENQFKDRWETNINNFMADISGWTLYFYKAYRGNNTWKSLIKMGLMDAIRQIYNLESRVDFRARMVPWPD